MQKFSCNVFLKRSCTDWIRGEDAELRELNDPQRPEPGEGGNPEGEGVTRSILLWACLQYSGKLELAFWYLPGRQDIKAKVGILTGKLHKNEMPKAYTLSERMSVKETPHWRGLLVLTSDSKRKTSSLRIPNQYLTMCFNHTFNWLCHVKTQSFNSKNVSLMFPRLLTYIQNLSDAV